MFKLRSGGQGASSPAQPPNIEAIRRSARHRLIGASVLVLAGVLGFPLLFDSQPRPIPVDMPIEIPAKGAVKPLGQVQEPAAAAARIEGLDAKEEVLASAPRPLAAGADAGKTTPDKVPAKPVVQSAPTAQEKPAEKLADRVSDRVAEKAPTPQVSAPAPDKPAAKTPEKVADKARVEPRHESKADAKTDAKADTRAENKGNQRLVVQVGAFADAARASEVRLKLEHAGLKTYVHVADTAEGKRTRVRLGPFATRAEADKAAARAKSLGLSGNILAL